MKRTVITFIYIATILFTTGCAKSEAPSANDANKRFFEAWLKVNNINVKPSGLGI